MFDFKAARAKPLLHLAAQDKVTCAALHVSDRALLLNGSEKGDVNLWQVFNGSLVTTLRDAASLGNATSALCWEEGCSDVNRLFAASDTGSIKLWDLQQNQVVNTLIGHRAPPTSLDHCPHSDTLASGSNDTTVKIWDPRSKEAAATLKGQGAAISAVRHSPDGLLVASGTDGGVIQVWDRRSGRALAELKQHTKRVHSLAFQPQEMAMASCSADRTVRYWDLQTYEQFDMEGPLAKEARVVAFPSDGRALLVAAPDGLRSFGYSLPGEEEGSDGVERGEKERDAVEVPWPKVSELCYFDSKVFGLSFALSSLDMWVVDLTQVRPYGEPRHAVSCTDRRRLSIQDAIVQGSSAITRSTGALRSRPTSSPQQPKPMSSASHRPPLPPGPGPAAQFVEERRRQLAACRLLPKPRPESPAAPGLRAVPAQRNSPTRSAPTATQGPGGQPNLLCSVSGASSCSSLGSESSTLVAGQHSASENDTQPALLTLSSWQQARPISQQGRAVSQQDGDCSAGSCELGGADVIDRIMAGHVSLRGSLQDRVSRLKEMRGLMERGDNRATVRALKTYEDVSLTMHVVAKWAAAPDVPLELCIEAAGLCGPLLASLELVNQDVGLQMVGNILQRWQGFIRSTLDAKFPRQGIDLEYERRQARCTICKQQLQTLLPALNELSAAKNARAAQLITQVMDL